MDCVGGVMPAIAKVYSETLLELKQREFNEGLTMKEFEELIEKLCRKHCIPKAEFLRAIESELVVQR